MTVDEMARELFPEHVECLPHCTYIARTTAALARAHAEGLEAGLEAAAQEAKRVAAEYREIHGIDTRAIHGAAAAAKVADRIRSLIPAAPPGTPQPAPAAGREGEAGE